MKAKWINDEALSTFSTYYYPRALWLEDNCNLGSLSPTSEEANKNVNDPLMQNVDIYNITVRRNAGFSNILEDLWFGDKTPKWDKKVQQRERPYQKL